jgi:hypothetical protein
LRLHLQVTARRYPPHGMQIRLEDTNCVTGMEKSGLSTLLAVASSSPIPLLLK